MKLILLGAPGAGKGTQADIIKKKLDIPTISTGNILRAAVKNGTPTGLKAKGYMDAGKLVPDEVIIGIINERLQEADCANGYILDGVPRTIAQAEALEQAGISFDAVVAIEIPDEKIIARMGGRRVCESCGASYHIVNIPPKKEGVCDVCGGALKQRKDDDPETVKDRLAVYHKETEPLKGFYEARGVLKTVDDQPTVEGTTRAILRVLGVERMITLKSPHEIELMRRAGKITAAARALARDMVKPGVTTAQIDKAVFQFIKEQGATPSFLHYNGYPASVCVSVNDEIIHGIPGKRVLQEGDIVSVDVGAFIGGFHGDCAGTYPCGQVSDEALRLIRVTQQSFFEGMKYAREGCRLSDISAAVQAYVEANGFSVVREYVGHGIGRQMHEAPEVPNYGKPGHGPRLLRGMTIAVEPMVNAGTAAIRQMPDGWTVRTADGKNAAHYENTVLITAGEPELLTDPEKSLV